MARGSQRPRPDHAGDALPRVRPGDAAEPAFSSSDTPAAAPWSLAASLAMHGVFVVAALLLVPHPQATVAPVPPSVSVEILAPDALPAARPAAPPVLAAPPPKSGGPPPAAAPTEPGMIVATRMLSAATLADPRSRGAVRDLATFSRQERMVQLCNLEAMDQIAAQHDGFRPETVVAYARSDEKISGDELHADGAAFRSRGNWYDLKFRCVLSAAQDRVVAFAFQIGAAVPRSDWEAFGLSENAAE